MATATTIKWGDCDECAGTGKQQLVQAWHYRYGYDSIGAVYVTDGSIYLTKAEVTFGNETRNVYYEPEGRTVTQIRYRKTTTVYTVDQKSGNVSTTSTTDYVTDWLYTTPIYELESVHSTSINGSWNSNNSVFLATFIVQLAIYHGPPNYGFTLSSTVTHDYTSGLSNQNTDANMLSLLDELLVGPWVNPRTEETGIDWNNQLYFDENLAHSAYYITYFEAGTGDAVIYDMTDAVIYNSSTDQWGTYFYQNKEFRKYYYGRELASNILVGYQLDINGGEIGGTTTPFINHYIGYWSPQYGIGINDLTVMNNWTSLTTQNRLACKTYGRALFDGETSKYLVNNFTTTGQSRNIDNPYHPADYNDYSISDFFDPQESELVNVISEECSTTIETLTAPTYNGDKQRWYLYVK